MTDQHTPLYRLMFRSNNMGPRSRHLNEGNMGSKATHWHNDEWSIVTVNPDFAAAWAADFLHAWENRPLGLMFRSNNMGPRSRHLNEGNMGLKSTDWDNDEWIIVTPKPDLAAAWAADLLHAWENRPRPLGLDDILRIFDASTDMVVFGPPADPAELQALFASLFPEPVHHTKVFSFTD